MPVEYNHEHENEITLFAETNFRNQKRRFGIKTDDRRRHIYIVGKTGMGKTTIMENLVLADIHAGHGCCFIDPHGDIAEKLLDYIPPNRINDVVYFNPADMEFPVGFNILEAVDDDKKHLVRDGLMGVFKKIWPDVWSARMEYILQNTVQALLDYPGATLLGINRMLVDAEYRKRVIAKIRDPIVKTFWVAEFSSWSEKYATEAIAPVQNKVGQFLSASIIRNIVAQVKSTVDLQNIMDEGKILIVNLSKGRIGEDNMKLLGGMVITKLQMAAMERVNIPEADRRDFYLYVDEFQNFANQSFANILSEARKFRLSLTVAHQYIKQLEEEVAWAVFGNVGTLVVFRVGSDDAMFMENEFMPTYTPEDLVNLTKYQVYMKLMVDGAATSAFSANTLPPSAQRTGTEEKVIAVSRERYATPRALIEEKVLKWSGMEVGIPEGVSYPSILTDEEREKAEAELGGVPAHLMTRSPERLQADTEALEGESAAEEKGPREYLKISEERLAMIVKPPAAGQKKSKPMFKHTCTRCGKNWDMPIQLDTSRPIYCSECLPLIKEERKVKTDVVRSVLSRPQGSVEDLPSSGKEGRLRQAFEGSGAPKPRSSAPPPSRPPQQRPRVVGEPRTFPPPSAPKGTIRIVSSSDNDGDSLLAALSATKGKPIETNKERLTGGVPGVGAKPSVKPAEHREPQKQKKESRPAEAVAERAPSPQAPQPVASTTVFKTAGSSVSRADRPARDEEGPFGDLSL